MSVIAPWIEAFIGLGSNLDNPVQQINKAHQAIAELANVEEVAFSPLYSSKPVGPQDQPDYINAVMQIKTQLSAQALLAHLQLIENVHGRVRSVRWGARTLDLDVLLYDQMMINEPDLIVPHPQLPNRAFVLYPLADIANRELLVPGFGRLTELLSACPANGIRRMA